MCFALPRKVTGIMRNIAQTEDGKTVKTGSLKVKKGDYIMIYGDMAVEKISSGRAEEFRKFIVGSL